MWTHVLLAFERLLVTAFPLFTRQHNTQRIAATSISVTTFVSALICGHFIVGNEIQTAPTTRPVTDVRQVQSGSTDQQVVCVPSGIHYKTFLSHVWSNILLYFFGAIPCVLIAAGNMVIVVILWRRRRLTQPSAALTTSRQASSLTKLFLVMSLFFFVTILPYSVFSTVFYKVHSSWRSDEALGSLQVTHAIVSVCIYANPALNFCLFCAVGKTFRNEAEAMYRELQQWARQWRNARVAPINSLPPPTPGQR